MGERYVESAAQDSPLKIRSERLHDCGQAVAIPLPRIHREGGLRKLIEQDGLTGVTSNPSIFEKATPVALTTVRL